MINLVSMSSVFSFCFLFHLLLVHWRSAQPEMRKLGGAGCTSQVSAQHLNIISKLEIRKEYSSVGLARTVGAFLLALVVCHVPFWLLGSKWSLAVFKSASVTLQM